jgi:two-component system sensor histidine kinase CreC
VNISVRLFFGYFLIVGLAAWFVLNVVTHETEPGVRQATEETLVDTAHVLAEMAALDLSADRIGHGAFADSVRAAIRRSPQADISGVLKEHVDFRVYVTDAHGVVVYDSKQAAVGEDFSQWRDIARVLRGEYGARQSREDPYDPASSVMHVAAPIFWQGELIGALSLAKPMSSVAPYAERAAQRVKASGLILLAASAAIGLSFTLWLGWSIHRLRDYARAVAEGRKAEAPTGGGRQLSELAQALATMREKLEGKQYVERYVQNLAHELKSPLTAILGAAEILESNPPANDRHRFTLSVAEQGRRLQAIIDRMLLLARVEQLQAPESDQNARPESPARHLPVPAPASPEQPPTANPDHRHQHRPHSRRRPPPATSPAQPARQRHRLLTHQQHHRTRHRHRRRHPQLPHPRPRPRRPRLRPAANFRPLLLPAPPGHRQEKHRARVGAGA